MIARVPLMHFYICTPPSYLVGGLSEFNVLHPSLCEISVPILKKSLNSSVSLRATTPGKW